MYQLYINKAIKNAKYMKIYQISLFIRKIQITFFFFFFGHSVAYGVLKPKMVSEPSCNLCHSWGHTGSLTHCAWMGIEPMPQQRPEPLQRQHLTLNPLYHGRNSPLATWVCIFFSSLGAIGTNAYKGKASVGYIICGAQCKLKMQDSV